MIRRYGKEPLTIDREFQWSYNYRICFVRVGESRYRASPKPGGIVHWSLYTLRGNKINWIHTAADQVPEEVRAYFSEVWSEYRTATLENRIPRING